MLCLRPGRRTVGSMRLFALVAIVVMAWPATALGATAKVSKSGARFHYTAAVGEANDVTATLDAGQITLQDPGASINPGRGCDPVSATEVACSFSGLDMEVDLGDLDDAAALTTLDRGCWAVSGGDGADTLSLLGTHRCGAAEGEGGPDVLHGTSLYGNRGNDVLTGTPGKDWFEAGSGNDMLLSKGRNDLLFPGLGDDTVDGGDGGGDTVFFFARAPVGVMADFESGIVTGGQGNDTLAGVECVNGSGHADRFYGDSHANCFGALGGDDYVNGRGGADSIQAGGGDDLIIGGPGRDELYGAEGDDGSARRTGCAIVAQAERDSTMLE